MLWTPLFYDNLKYNQSCLKIIKDINAKRTFLIDNSILEGKIGLAILNFTFGNFVKNLKLKERTYSQILRFIHSPCNVETHTFCNGLSGISWAIDLMINQEWLDIENPYSYLHKDIYNISIELSKQRDYDYLHGSLGICLNALENLDRDAETYLKKVIDILIANADKNSNGIAWQSIEFESQIPTYNLGLSHGIPSIIAIVSYIYEAEIAKDKCLELLNGSIYWLLLQKLPKNSLSVFPYTVPVDKPENYLPAPSRLAWCYGDLGIARSIWLAGKATNNQEWKQEATDIIFHASKRRNLKENMVFDAGLCHGSAGIAHIFNRFYQDTKIEEFNEAATYWYDVTLGFAKFEDGIGGYKMYVPPKEQNEKGRWENAVGLLEGSTGIGLALLAAISEEEPEWDRCLLLS